MTDFKADLRHRCRNPRCRSKLPAPVSNPREAFCCRGCYESFYLHRCRVCESGIKQPQRGQRLICKKAKCRNAFRDKSGFGCYAVSSDAESISKALINAGVVSPIKVDRTSGKPTAEHWTGIWAVLRVVAGPPIRASAYYCAVVGAGDVLAESDRANEARRRAAKAGRNGYCCAEPTSPPVDCMLMSNHDRGAPRTAAAQQAFLSEQSPRRSHVPLPRNRAESGFHQET